MNNYLKMFFLNAITFFAMFSKPPIGLANCGNTCFINSVLQCLNTVDPFIDLLINNPNQFDPKDTSAVNQCAYYLIEVFKKMNNQNSALAYSTLKSFIDNAYAAMKTDPYTQQDAQELVTTILTSLSTKKNYEDGILDLFNFSLTSILSCPNIQVSTQQEQALLLSLPIKNNNHIYKNIYEAFTAFIRKEIVQYKPEGQDSDRDCMKQLKLTDASKYLLIMLKRYEVLLDGSQKKINDSIDMPLILRIPSETFTQILPNQEYHLIAYASHQGTIGSGHYIALVQKDNKWYQCNDTIITEMAPNNPLFNKIKNTAYLYIYKKNIPSLDKYFKDLIELLKKIEGLL